MVTATTAYRRPRGPPRHLLHEATAFNEVSLATFLDRSIEALFTRGSGPLRLPSDRQVRGKLAALSEIAESLRLL